MTPLEVTATCIGIFVGLGAIGTGIVQLIKPLVKSFKNFLATWNEFIEDWKGSPADSGHDAQPGVMERLNNLDGEFKRNSGSTLKDAVSRIEAKLEQVDERLEKGNLRMDRIESFIEKKKQLDE
jgi:predicted PurR-regulated permease PerM